MYKIFEYGETSARLLLTLLNDGWKVLRSDTLPIATGGSKSKVYGKIIYILFKEPGVKESNVLRGGGTYE